MASSDEEGEVLPDCVTDYHFVDEKGQPTSFSILPLRWNNDETLEGSGTQAFLRGIADNGLQQIYKKVIAWKLELSYVLPEIYVLTKENWWIKLQRPRKSFQDAIKTIMITIHCLHHVKKNPEVSRDALWNHMLKAFSSHEVEPSEDDLLDHMLLVKQAVLMDKDLAKSQVCSTYINLGYMLTLFCHPFDVLLNDYYLESVLCFVFQENRTTKRYDFIVDTYDEYSDDGDDECHNSQDMLFDYVCALCDNGGQLLCCEGRCIRSFHATLDAGAESFCESLGFTDAQVEAIPSFVCKNCQYQQHQCFTCGMLGSSDKSSGAEVLILFDCLRPSKFSA
ncbi:hypothetical protein RJ639_017287 [Escallonia herrerae]|uniref:RFTS domain-containing protein n=1 Tax=Escallonia herrerae TaxID=1293975 RepID=A0AA88VB09_9ASTE|nr:hypothetical protein RJ639_017287 [Escallonia herrerae]